MSLLVPPPAVGAVISAAVIASLSVHDTISLGSIITASAVIVAGGLVTLRNNVKSFWRGLAEERGEKINQLTTDAEEKLLERAAFAEEQRELRHQLKSELAAAQGLIEVERAKHDMTAVYSRLDKLEQTIDASVRRQETLLTEILRRETP